MSLAPDPARYQPRRSVLKVEEPSQPWTTARCQRLLRPLVSRIASLRKAAIEDQITTPASIPNTGPAPASSAKRNVRREEQDTGSEWLMPRKKRARLTYSQRRGTQPIRYQSAGPGQSDPQRGNHDEYKTSTPGTRLCVKRPFKCLQPDKRLKANAPGEIAASTPLLRRARGDIAFSPAVLPRETDLHPDQIGLGPGNRIKAGRNTRQHLRKCHQLLKAERLETICWSFEALLKATTPGNVNDTGVASGPRGPRGPRSLLEMCLRKVPQYIVELEAWERLEAEQTGTISTLDDINTSAQVYNELETLGTNVGWKHLRVVVRADGLNAIKQGIKEGLFDDGFSQCLIDICVQLEATSEAEELITTLVDRQYPQPTSTSSHLFPTSAFQPLISLNSFADQTQRTPFLFRQYSLLLLNGNLSRDWLATPDFERIWSLVTQALTSSGLNYDAMNFMTQSILLLCGRKRSFTGNADSAHLEQEMAKASQRTLMSSLSILASMHLLGETELGQPSLLPSDIRRITIIGDRLRYVIKACLKGLDGSKRGRGNENLDLLYLTLFLSSGLSQDAKVENYVRGALTKLFQHTGISSSTREARTRRNYENIAWLIASIARAYDRGASVTPHQCLDELFKRLESLKLSQPLLDKLKAVAAFFIAQQTSNVRDLIYAESLYLHNPSNSSAPAHELNSNSLFTGYRWEETIGEWVTVSPVRDKRRASIKSNLRSSTQGGSTERSLTRSRSTASLGAKRETMSDTETNLDEDLSSDECSTDEGARLADKGRGTMMKTRLYRARNIETLATTSVVKATVRQPNPAVPASSKFEESQLGTGKENRGRLLAKKARRSSGRVVLGTRSLSCNSVGRGKYRDGVYSDDELCI